MPEHESPVTREAPAAPPGPRRPTWSRYVVAVAAIAAVLLSRIVLDPLLGKDFAVASIFLAVLAVAWYGGFGPAVVVSVGGLLAVGILFPSASAEDGDDGYAGLVFYFLITFGIAALGAAMAAARRRADAAADHLETTLSSIGDAVLVADADGRATSLNPIAERLTGWTSADARGRPLAEVFRIINEQTRRPVENPVTKVLREGTIVGLANHTVLIARDGTERPIDDSAAPIRDAGGDVIGVVLVFRDVSERRRGEAVQRRLAAIVESSVDAIIGKSLDGTITNWNDAAERLYGYAAAEAVGRSFSILLPEGRKREQDVSIQRLREGKRVANFESVRRRKDGKLIDVSVSYSPIRDPEGRPIGAAVIARDISEQKQIERDRNARAAVAQILAQAHTLDGAVTQILEAVCRHLNWGVGALWQLDHDLGLLKCLDVWHLPQSHCEPFASASRRVTFRRNESLPGRVWAEERPIWLPDVTEDEDFVRREQATESNLHAGLAAPIVVDGGVTGVIEFFKSDIRDPDEDLLETVTTIAGLIAQFMERLRVLDGLRRSEADLADFFENASVGLHWVGPDGTILRVNRAELELLGYSREEYVGRNITEFHVDRAVIDDILARLLAGEELRDCPARMRRKDGTICDVLIDSSGLFQGEQFIHSRCFTRDVTEKKQAEDALRREQSRFAAVINHSPVCIFAKDLEGRFLFANQAMADTVGCDPEEIIGKRDADFMSAEIAEVFAREDAAVLESGDGRTIEETFEIEDRRVDALTVKFPLRDTAGKIYAVCGILTEVTQFKRIEQELRDSEQRLRLALDAGHMGVWDWNIRTNELDWTDLLEPIHGLAPGAFDGTFAGFEKLIHPEDREKVLAAIRRAVETQSDYEIEFRNLRPDRSVHWILGKGRVYSDDAGPQRMIGVGMDVTQRKFSEETARFLAQASAELASLVDYESTLQKVAGLAVPFFADWCVIDMDNGDGTLRRAAIAHVDPDKIEMVRDLHRRYPADPEATRGVWNILRTGQSEITSDISDELIEATVPEPERRDLMLKLGLRSYIGAPIVARGKVLGAILFVSAETGRRYREADLAVAEDLAHRAGVAIENVQLYQQVREADRRKDEFLAMLAHELRNPLAPIRSGLELLALEGSGQRETVELMQEQVGHLVRLVDDLLDVSRIVRGKVALRHEHVSLNDVVKRTAEAVATAARDREQEFVVDISDDPLRVHADPVRLAQVVENLLSNASKYTDPGGRIELTVHPRDGQAEIRVRDNGIGIEPELLPHVFELFTQSTRALDRAQGGLGIGLTLVRNLVELHGGTISARSKGVGQGSEFIVRLPLVEARADSAPPPKPAATNNAPRRILVVDDNVGAARLLTLLIGRMGGHTVRTAHDGPAALSLLEDFRPDVVLLDIGLPGMDGYEVGRRIRANSDYDDVLLAALTGYGQPEDLRRSREAGFDEHLVKPMSLETLIALLNHPKLHRSPRTEAADEPDSAAGNQPESTA